MKRWQIAAAAMLALTFTAAVRADDSTAEGDWIQLFNGKNLDGWTPKIKGYDAGDNFGNTFRVEDGLLTVSYDQYGGKFNNRFGHLFYDKPFSSYVLRVEYRFIGDQMPDGEGWAFRNSGIMIDGQSPQSMRKDQDFPVSVEVQLLGGSGKGERPTGNVCTPGTNIVIDGKLITRHCNNSKSKTYNGDQWVAIEVETHAYGPTKISVNGEPVMEYSEPQLDETDADARRLIKNGDKMLHGGTISLQSESHPVQFRKVELKVLDK